MTLASPQSNAERKLEIARQSAVKRLGAEMFTPPPGFTGGCFICSICQKAFVLDEIDVEYLRRCNPEMPNESPFFPACHACIGFTSSMGFQMYVQLCGIRGFGYWLRMAVLRHLFLIVFSQGARTTTEIRAKSIVEPASSESTTNGGEAKP